MAVKRVMDVTVQVNEQTKQLYLATTCCRLWKWTEFAGQRLAYDTQIGLDSIVG